MRIHVCLILFMLLISNACGQMEVNREETKTGRLKSKSGGPYCGINCLYTAMKLSGGETQFRKLLKTEYISSYLGSSLAELKSAAEDHSMHGVIFGNLTTKDLRRCTHPVILHVKRSAELERYDHFILYLGKKGDLALIFDAPGPVEAIEFDSLLPVWDGSCLVVAAEPIDVIGSFLPSHGAFFLYATILVAVVLAIQVMTKRLPHPGIEARPRQLVCRAAVGAFGIGMIATVFGYIYHVTTPESLLTAPHALATVQQAHRAEFLPKVSKRQVRRLLDTETVFLDARLVSDFNAGHLEGAISLPVNANDTELHRVTADIGKDDRIVIYCQSSGCKYAETVALRLSDEGYSDISIFKGGWRAYRNKG